MIVAVMASAFFSGAETALIAARRIKLEVWARRGVQGAKGALLYLQVPEQFLTTTLVGNNISIVAASSLLAFYLSPLFNGFVLTAISSLILLVFGEILPKSIARERATSFTLRLHKPLKIINRVLYPIVWFVLIVSKLFLRLLGLKDKQIRRFFSRDDLEILIREGEETGVVDEKERAMISRFIRRGNQNIKDIMIPRTEMTVASWDTTTRSLFKIFVKTGYSRLPVIGSDMDHVKGMILAKDLLLEKPFHLRKHIRDILFIPETRSVASLLKEMRLKGNSMAIVVDEYGGTAGLVTIEDLVEEFFGEIRDEFDEEKALYRNIQKHQIVVRAKIPVEELNERFALNIPEGEYQSLGGFLSEQLGHIPKRGEKVDLTLCTLKIISTSRTKVNWVRIIRKKSPPAAD
jgi:putative hemolysin